MLILSTAFGAIDNKGKEFFLGFLHNSDNTEVTLELHLTSEVATTVQVEYPVGTIHTTVNLAPNNVTIVGVPTTAVTGLLTQFET